jgi:hypothetical protein
MRNKLIELVCPCSLREHMEEDDCAKMDCNKCCPLAEPPQEDE